VRQRSNGRGRGNADALGAGCREIGSEATGEADKHEGERPVVRCMRGHMAIIRARFYL